MADNADKMAKAALIWDFRPPQFGKISCSNQRYRDRPLFGATLYALRDNAGCARAVALHEGVFKGATGRFPGAPRKRRSFP